ncbi:hypothetical protein A6B39_09750 [Mannheimia granulomatis]|uniref:Slam-dependent surface lipoprotein n=1 Tax=Mannheimia granulomatis TaxID=85402 RepID=UPI00159DD9F3|nr:Slam-dependent surface lipoprotein [Mannheimia granulomatis]QLB15717.1 hypothetical protein A6B39_09750 [Mannheimia granulomatis]
MKKLAKLSLTLLAVTVISACGSSGGSSDNSNSQATSSKPTVTTTAPTKPTTTNPTTKPTTTKPTTSTSSSDKMGTAFRVNDSKEFDIKKASTYKTELVVDSKTLPVAWNGIVSGGFTKLSNATINGVTYKDFTVSGARYSSVKFGHIDGYVFTQGDVTPKASIPTSGNATYLVDGVFVANGKTSTSQGHSLNVDFANKTLNGTIATDVTVTNAKISGNEFEGKAVHNGKSAELEGHFYGSNAAEIGGAYSSSNFSGAFGGKKQ